MLKILLAKTWKHLFSVLVVTTAPLQMLWAQDANEKYSLTTQMFLQELKEKAVAPQSKPRRTLPFKKAAEVQQFVKKSRLIASPDTVGGVAYISCFIHLKDVGDLNEVCSLGVSIEETFEGLGFVTARVPVSQIERLAKIDNVSLIKVAQRMTPMTDVAKQKTNADDVLTLSADAIAQGVTSKYDGTGVVLGVIDTGIDFQHIAFKDKNGNSRIKRAYVYDGSTGTEYSSITSSSPTTDDNTGDHGTHTATTAGGSSVIVSGSTVTVTDNHANATYGGMAPGADLYLAGVNGLSDTYLSNALKKMVEYADAQGKPLVVSNSWGSGLGPHDGTGEWAGLVGQYFGDSYPDHVILFAASNDGRNASKDNEGGGYFVKKSLASSSSPLATIMRNNYFSDGDAGCFYSGVMACAWSKSKPNCKLYVLDNSTGAIKTSWTVTQSTTTFTDLDTYYSGSLAIYIETVNGKYRLLVYSGEGLMTQGLSETTKNGSTYYKSNYTLAIEVYPASGSANVDMWAGTGTGTGNYNYFTNHLSTSGHTWVAGTDDMCVSDQATIPDAISVGAYVSKTSQKNYQGSTYSYSAGSLGDIAVFSSYATAAQSPTGLAYPWITAPGAQVVAGVNHYHTSDVDNGSYYYSGNSSRLVVNNTTNPYAVMQGTSMATPVAAGIVAQWLQAAKSVGKSLTVNDVKDIMAQTAINDSYTTTGANASHFGNGKIDALAGIKYILDTEIVHPEVVTIGDDATTSSYNPPFCNYYKNSTAQMLYTPAEIGKGGEISSIAFKVASASPLATSEVNIYLGHKSGTFASKSDFVDSNNLTLVYSGSPTLGQSAGWETLTFNQGEFTYNGTDNLVVVVTRKSSSYTNSLKYYYYTGSGYALYRQSDSDTSYGEVMGTSNYTASTNRPSVRFAITESQAASSVVEINEVNFPDENFRNYLLAEPYGQDGVLTEEEIQGVTTLHLAIKEISTLKGIEYFTALQSLNASLNQLTSLDMTKNTALQYLNVYENQLTSLDVSENTQLTLLECGDNQLTSLDVSKNTALTILGCRYNQLTTLDVSNNTALQSLDVYDNQLTSLNVSKNADLTSLDCSKNQIHGSSMDGLIASLPQATTTRYIYVYDNTSGNEGNVCTKTQVAAIKAKGWAPQYYEDLQWKEYEGSEDESSLLFTAESTNGVTMTFKITNEEAKTCQIGTGNAAAIDASTSGKVVLPLTANGYAVTAIAANAFKNCSIHEIVIPNSIRTIGESAFEGCKSSWGSLYVQSFIEEPFDIPESAFSNIGTTSLNSFYGKKDAYLAVTGWDKFTNYYNDLYFLNGILYSVNGAVPEEKGDPYTAWAEPLPEWSFYSGEVVIPETFKIGEETFTVVGIDNRAFENSSITSVSIPKTVRSIDSNAFADCPQLLVVKSYIVEPKDESWSFVNVPANATLYVPAGTKALYETLGGWNLFTTIIEMEDEEPEPGTDISQMENVIYVDAAEGIADGRMTFYVSMKNSVVSEGFFFRLYLPDGFNYTENLDGKLDVSLYTDENRFNKSNIEFDDPYIDDDGSLVVNAQGKNGYTISGNDGKIVRIRVMVPENMPIGNYLLLIRNGQVCDNMGTMWPLGTIPDVKSTLTVANKVRGDANGDAEQKDVPTKNNDKVNAGDYVTISHYILGLPYNTLDKTAADVNGDGVINGADLTAITLLKKRGNVTQSAPRLAEKVGERGRIVE